MSSQDAAREGSRMGEKEQREAIDAKLTAVQNTLGSLLVRLAQFPTEPLTMKEAEMLFKALHSND